MYNFNSDELAQIKANGSSQFAVQTQLHNFVTGFSFLKVKRPASVGDGIIVLSDTHIEFYLTQYDAVIINKELIKFTPASGAATRMFKSLSEFLSDGKLNNDTERFIANIKGFAFFSTLVSALEKKRLNVDSLLEEKNYHEIISHLLNEEEMAYGSFPKGLLEFHSNEKQIRTPLEEHLVEGALYAKTHDNHVHLHFTVSPEHQDKFESLMSDVIECYEEKFNVKYQISFSQQKQSTNTIAVDLENKPFKENGELLFRPAGHGALLENLNDLNTDIIFVKNIDNVVPDKFKEDTIIYKKALVGLLVDVQKNVFSWIEDIESGRNCLLEVVEHFKSQYAIDLHLETLAELKRYLFRPIRVCGMVKNTGEPGGGPFWVENGDGESLQILESAQINLNNDDQAKHFEAASHFNPVDLVCAVKNHKGEKFDLLKYRNDKAGFITNKSRGGKELKAMELPGLWNGAMADWITLFVEVPISTFNPVKSVTDLLKEAHQ